MRQLEAWFGIASRGSTVAREVGAGLTTYLTLCYVLFVHPAILAAAGMDPGGVLFATCVASAVGCLLMALWANYPIALAPAMGHNAFFAFTVCGAMGFSWQQALAANALAGGLFLVLALTRLREAVMAAIPQPLRAGLGAGIGLLLAMLGLQWGNLVVADPHTLVRLGDLHDPVALLALLGLLGCSVLLALRVRAAMLIGILGTAAAGWLAGLVHIDGIVGAPPAPTTAFALDFAGLLDNDAGRLVLVIGTLMILDLFDTAGTLIAVAQRAGLMVGDQLPRARGALAADAGATVVGACLGTSTVSSYVESAAGVAAGGRTGLTAVVVAACLLLSLFCTPLIEAIGAGVEIASGDGQGGPPVVRYPVLAPALVLVGALMAGTVRDVDWSDARDSIPAFATLVIIPLAMSITDGIAFGMMSYSALALATRRPTPPLVHGLAALFVLRYALM